VAKLDHVGVAVQSIAQARRLYDTLGLAVLDEQEDDGVRSVMIPLGESQLRLQEQAKGEGLHHVAIHVDDISASFESLKHAGIPLLSEEIEIGDGGRLHFQVNPTAANGVLLEICQDPISAV
jgi:methylmalonyl-CoA/ethylmalonyl-CoA epimerase